MKEIQQPKEIFTVELTLKEVQMIRDLTQNYTRTDAEETFEEHRTRTSLFVGASRMLGYNMNDDGSINRNESKDWIDIVSDRNHGFVNNTPLHFDIKREF